MNALYYTVNIPIMHHQQLQRDKVPSPAVISAQSSRAALLVRQPPETTTLLFLSLHKPPSWK